MASRNDEINSVIGEGSVFEGKFYVNGSLQISGKFEGELHTEDHLIIAEPGKVKTNITSRKVTVAGTLIGNIDATEEVVLMATGRVMGNITTPVFSLQKGGISKGEVIITGGQSKDVDKMIRESWAASPGYEHYSPKKGEGKEKGKDKKEG
ncbi:MAG: polymer-forming cytoskeletal protein [Spirochaetes bacterium]|nr:polymer-forming cytoskeletal protein [Spirochaetota bacterium]